MRNNIGDKGVGFYNYERSKNDKVDALAAQSSVEADPIPWAARTNVSVVQRADKWFEVAWVTIGK